MCGIFGMKYVDPGMTVNREMIVKATDLMSRRGPDDAGYWVQGSLGLGHRRLSIIDLSPLGHQPMFNEDGRIALVYNGEIYNFQELYAQLCAKGHVFRSRSDSEVIIHAYEEWGYDCVQKFNGMFAFAIWDEVKRSLWLVRDRLGVKPLYYYWDGNVFIFASEIKPILKSGVVKAEMNERVLDAYFSLGYVPGPDTIFKGIMKLVPGNFLSLQNGSLTQQEYWDFADVNEMSLTPRQYEERLEELLRDSIFKRLRSDVPLGVFLSGGLDSSAVVALMSEINSEAINTFTVGYDMEKNFSEEPFAALVASSFNTRHNVFKLEPTAFFSSMEKLVEFAEEPIVEPAAIALYHISKMARQDATVLLSGEGSDELFGGYYLYEIMKKIDRFQRVIPAPLHGFAKFAASFSGQLKLKKYADWLHLPLEKRYQGTSSYLTDSMKKTIYSRDFYATKGSYLEETFSAHFTKVRGKKDSLGKMLYVDTKTWLADDLLVKADKMTMAASIELRVPFLDYRLVELAASYPSEMKISAGNGKVILKSLMKSRLPETIVNRKKMGFPVPLTDWFKGELAYSMQKIKDSAELKNWISPQFIENSFGAGRSAVIADNGKLVMSLLVLLFWRDRYLSDS